MHAMSASSPVNHLFTGSTPSIKANPYLAEFIWQNAAQGGFHSVRDIYDSKGVMLWARNQPVDPELMGRLIQRELREPIELCINADDPVSASAIETVFQQLCASSPALKSAIAGHEHAVLGVFHALTLTPQELLLISLLRCGSRDYLAHSVAVTAIALTLANELGLEPRLLSALAHAGLLHDVGRLYWPSEPMPDEKQRIYDQHPLVSALAAVEMGKVTHEVGQLIACSHERLDGSGFPLQLKEDQIPPRARILLFAEAICEALLDPALGLLRAAVSARLVAHEFDSHMAKWIGAIARAQQDREAEQPMPEQATTIGRRLRQLHAQLSRAVVLLSLTINESLTARESADIWLQKKINPLMFALRSCGVEDALAMGLHMAPESAVEAKELEALLAEILSRLKRFARHVEWQRYENEFLSTSTMARELLQILNTCSSIIHKEAASCP